jgi:pilus assembly protein Flp/PilA
MIFQQLSMMLQNAVRNEEGQDLTEYALLLVFIAIAAVAAVTLLGGQVTTIFNNITSALGG